MVANPWLEQNGSKQTNFIDILWNKGIHSELEYAIKYALSVCPFK